MVGRCNILCRGIMIVLAVCLCSCAVPQMPVAGTLHGEVSWQGRVYLDGDVVLGEGSRLLIAPGSEIVFLPASEGRDLLTAHPNFPGSELIIRGELVAEGTAAAPITFRHLDPRAPAGSWGGINLSQSPRASFRFCRFTQADSAVHSQESTVFVEESLFENNLVGIRFFSSDMLIENNLLRRNGTAIRFHFGSPVICRNEIVDNRRAFFFTSYPRDFHIRSNTIRGSSEYAVVLGEEVPDDVPMPENYWGTTDLAAIEASFFDGRRTGYLGAVRVVPVLAAADERAGISWNP